MPEAHGFSMAVTSGGQFLASFPIAGTQYTFRGNFVGRNTVHFSCTGVLKYTDASQLASTQTLDGTVGPTKLHLNFNNGPTIEGDLDDPLSDENHVEGRGAWTQG